MFSYAIRITLPYDDCKPIISQWADRSSSLIVFEHLADEEISKTHIHIAIGGCEVKTEALKRMWSNAPGKGNEFWSWKDWDGTDKYITYMTKGKLSPKFVKNFLSDEVERSRQGWVEPVKADKPGDHTERLVAKIIDKIKLDFVYRTEPLTDEEICDRVECSVETLLRCVRRETFRQLWGEHRRFPHASQYKIVAGTAYMRLCEHFGCFEAGMDIISRLWL